MWVISPTPASAHAQFVKSVPESGALLDTSPPQIEIYLSEGSSLEFSTVKLYDRARNEQQVGELGRVNGDDKSVLAPIPQTLPPGTYTVVWRILSGVDGHVTAGTFAFRVKGTGNEAAEPIVPISPIAGSAAIPSSNGFDNADPLRWLVRALMLAMAIVLLGGPIFTVLVVEPTDSETKEGQKASTVAHVASKRFAGIGTIAGVVLLLLLILDLIMQVASVNGTGLLGALGHFDAALRIINTTRYGFAWLLKALAGVVLVALMLYAWQVQRRNASWVWEIALAAASLLFLAQALGSHGAAASEAGNAGSLPIPIVSDWLHLVMAGTWIGGLAYMGFALFPAFKAAGLDREERRVWLGRSTPRFSRLAVISVVVLAVTGTYNMIIHTADLGAILGSPYGQVLAVKVAAYAVLVGIGAINLRRLTPMLLAKSIPAAAKADAADGGGPARKLGRNIKFEMGLGAVALLCAGGLTLLPPPSTVNSAALPSVTPIAEVATPLPTPQPATASNTTAGYTFNLTTRPSFEGDQLTLDLERTDPASLPLTDVAKVLFRITPQDVDAGSSSFVAEAMGTPGPDKQTWHATESFLTIDGGYLVTAIVQRTESPDVKAAFRLDLSESGLKATPADVVDVLLSTEPSEPVSGTVTLSIGLVDGARKPIDGATVTVNPYMPAHAHVQPPSVAPPVPGQAGLYSIPVQLDMGGGWLLIFTIEREGHLPLKIDASVDVIDPNATPTPLETP